MPLDLFENAKLLKLLRIEAKAPRKVNARESGNLEFKQSFNWNSREKYARTMAAFANTKGGYLVFGVKNSPRDLVGINKTKFEDMDPEKVTQYLQNHFAPEIQWEMNTVTLSGVYIGLVYIFESNCKPVVCQRQAGQGDVLKEGEIYYRYRGRTERIKYPEIKSIIDEIREREQKLWRRHFLRISKAGVENVGILNTTSGELSGSRNSILIDETLLSKLKFIKEGEFSEKKGAPTLRLVGDLKTAQTVIQPVDGKTAAKAGIRTGDIVLTFLNKEAAMEPKEYLKQICFESSAFLPIYYFLSKANWDRKTAKVDLKKVNSRSPAKDKLLQRLSKTEKFRSGSIESGSSAAVKIADYLQQLKQQKKIDSLPAEKDLQYLLKAVTHLEKGQFNQKKILSLLKEIFESQYETAGSTLADLIRKAICHIDLVLYGPKIK